MRISVYIVLFLVAFNAAPGLLDATGISQTHGLDQEAGAASDQINEANERLDDPQTSGGGLQTLFGLYATLTRIWDTVVNIIFPGAVMVKNAGVPDALVNFVMSVVTIVAGLDIIDFFRSGGLTD
jgi:hypothetical protein